MSSSQVDRELHSGGDAGGGHRAVSITSEVLVVAIVFFFVAVVVVFFLHIYTKMRWYRRASNTVGNARAAHSAHGADGDPSAILQKGLDPDVIRFLPILVLHRSDLKEGSECAVCLSEFADSEKARLLPNCNHRFHLDCIDVWFRSHSTCPLCRSPVGPQSASNSCAGGAGPSTPVEAVSTESLNLPTNVLFWGTQDQISTGGGSPPQATGGMQDSPSSSSSPPASGDSKGVLVIDIPRRAVEELTSSEERKSPEGAATGTPGSTRLRSFRRLLTRVRASGGDIEQGAVEVLVE